MPAVRTTATSNPTTRPTENSSAKAPDAPMSRKPTPPSVRIVR